MWGSGLPSRLSASPSTVEGSEDASACSVRCRRVTGGVCLGCVVRVGGGDTGVGVRADDRRAGGGFRGYRVLAVVRDRDDRGAGPDLRLLGGGRKADR